MINMAYFVLMIFRVIDKSSILSSLFVSILIGLFLIYIFRWPDFTLNLDLIMQKETGSGVLDFNLKNNKKFMSYNEDEVYFFFYIPVRILSRITETGERLTTKQFFLITKNGSASWEPLFNIRDRSSYNIGGEEYFLVRGTAKLDILSERKTQILRVTGNFNQSEDLKIYYWFSTKHGIYPHYIMSNQWPFIEKYEGKFEDVIAGKLPSSIISEVRKSK